MASAYPLTWPKEWPRTKSPAKSAFKTTLAGALKNVEDSVRLFASDSEHKVEGLVISSNVTLGAQNPADSGVALYFTWDGISTCIAVDRYRRVEENLQAIHHVIEAERTKLRHGGLNLVRAAFRGYAALPPPSSSKRPWRQVLELGQASHTNKEIEEQYRRLAKRHHPDNGGSVEKMSELSAAIAEFRKEQSGG